MRQTPGEEVKASIQAPGTSSNKLSQFKTHDSGRSYITGPSAVAHQHTNGRSTKTAATPRSLPAGEVPTAKVFRYHEEAPSIHSATLVGSEGAVHRPVDHQLSERHVQEPVDDLGMADFDDVPTDALPFFDEDMPSAAQIRDIQRSDKQDDRSLDSM